MTRVLVVDDCADSILVLSRLLTRAGHGVTAARNGQEALRLTAEFRPQVVFLDLWMPGMDGYQVAARLRKLSGLDGIRIVALSGAKPDEELDKMAGIDAHLLKPAGLAALLAAMNAGSRPAQEKPRGTLDG